MDEPLVSLGGRVGGWSSALTCLEFLRYTTAKKALKDAKRS